jgi:hypothetical protein
MDPGEKLPENCTTAVRRSAIPMANTRLFVAGPQGAAGTNRIRVISDGTPKRFGGPQ